MAKLILMQDDCAPDSLEFFDKQMFDLLGMDIEMFKSISIKKTQPDYFKYIDGEYYLEISADDPFWKLYKTAT